MVNENDIDAGDLLFAAGQIIRRVEGTVAGIVLRPSKTQGGTPMCVFQLVEIQNDRLLAITPYSENQYEVLVQFSQNGKRWAAFCDSIYEITGQYINATGIKQKQVEFTWVDDIESVTRKGEGDNAVWEDALVEGWKVSAIDGKRNAVVSKMDNINTVLETVNEEPKLDINLLLIELADGEEGPEFLRKAITNDTVKSDMVLMSSVVEQGEGILAQFVTDGKLSKGDDGVYHKV